MKKGPLVLLGIFGIIMFSATILMLRCRANAANLPALLSSVQVGMNRAQVQDRIENHGFRSTRNDGVNGYSNITVVTKTGHDNQIVSFRFKDNHLMDYDHTDADLVFTFRGLW